MTNFLVKPNRHVVITDADSRELPILSFHIVVIVEPDPETWMGAVELNFGEALELFVDGLDAELFPDDTIDSKEIKIATTPDGLDRPILLWVKYTGDDNLFDKPAYTADAIFRLAEYDQFDHLEFYLQGIKRSHPDWKVAIVGGTYEDDIMRVANFIEGLGFAATVLTRQCISRNVFINLDELMKYKSWLDKHRLPNNHPKDFDDLFEV